MEPSPTHRRRENHGVGEQAGLRNHRTRLVRLKVPVRGVVGFPNPVEVGFARDASRSVRSGSGYRLGLARTEPENARDRSGNRNGYGRASA